MNRQQLLEALRDVQRGATAPEALLDQLTLAPYEDIGYAKIDHHRQLRNGNSEVIYGAGKTAEQISGILSRMIEAGSANILITRMDPDKAAKVEWQGGALSFARLADEHSEGLFKGESGIEKDAERIVECRSLRSRDAAWRARRLNGFGEDALGV